MHGFSLFGRWGLLPLAAPALAFIAMRLGASCFPRASENAGEQAERGFASDRAVGGALLSIALVIVGTRLLGLLHGLTPGVLGFALVASVAACAILGRDARFDFPWRALCSRASLPLVAAALFALGAALVAAALLPIWQADALGYHLPYAMFALAAHATRGVPDGAPYISTYPHAIELFIIALRALLPDDRLVDLAQVPFGLLGAVATVGLARKLGGSRPAALGAGAAWLVLPAVFLQLPTDYVDVGSASLLLCSTYFLIPRGNGAGGSRAELLLGVLALGLYAGSKPNAPLGAALLSFGWLARYWRTNHLRLALGALALAALFASESFVSTALHHGNPLWPARIDLGPLHLPGRNPLRELLESGQAAPRLHGPLLWRVLRSWTSLSAPPICDMRYGGLGPIFLLALVPAALTLLRLRSGLVWLALAAALATPDPSIARYVLAFPALVFALASPRLDSLQARLAPRGYGAVPSIVLGALGAAQLAYAWPGLTGEGPPLAAYWGKSEAERLAAVGADGRPDGYIAARARLLPGESFAFDSGFDMPYLAWNSDGQNEVLFISDDVREEEIPALLEARRVRVAAVKDGGAAGRFLAAHPEQFEKLLFSSRTAPCSVYARR